MRNFLLAFVLLNLLAFAYQRWIIEPAAKVDALDIEQAVPRLQVATRPSPPRKDTQADGARCLRIGPFLRADAADQIRQRLVSQGAVVQQTAEPGQVWVGHWVQVAVKGDRSAAVVARDRLQAAGLRDAYIVSGAPLRRISLGVFRLLSSADRVVDQARELGYEPTVTERYQPGTNFWLRARLLAEQRLDAGDLTGARGQIVRSEAVPCSPQAS